MGTTEIPDQKMTLVIFHIDHGHCDFDYKSIG